MAEVKEVLSTSKEVLMDALFIVAGAMLGKVVLDYVGKALPMANDYKEIVGIPLGAAVAYYTNGIPRKLAIGFSTYSAIAALNRYVMPVVEPMVSKVSA